MKKVVLNTAKLQLKKELVASLSGSRISFNGELVMDSEIGCPPDTGYVCGTAYQSCQTCGCPTDSCATQACDTCGCTTGAPTGPYCSVVVC